MTDMEHMNHINSIAEADTDMLRHKEETYHGSWKRAGGRSAWFMMRRNMDRLITMMTQPKKPELFKIQNVRDLTDNISRAGFDNKSMNVTIHTKPLNYVKDLSFLCASFTAEDVFAKIEEQPNGDDGTVLACIRDLRRYLLLIEAEMVARGVVSVEKINVKPNTVIIDETVKPGTPEDGGHHALLNPLSPWVINESSYRVMCRRVGCEFTDKFYHKRGTDTYRVIGIVLSDQVPMELRDIYEYTDSRCVLLIGKCPEELKDDYSKLQREMNQFEFETSPEEYRFMYGQQVEHDHNKWVLRKRFDAWGREN